MSTNWVMVFWIIIGVLLLTLFSFLVILSLNKNKKTDSLIKNVGLLPAYGIAIIGLALIVFIAYGIIASKDPAYNFKVVFGEEPRESVSDLKAKTYWYGKSSSIYMIFKTTEEEFKNLVPDSLKAISVNDFSAKKVHDSKHQNPEWWDLALSDEDLTFLHFHDNPDEPGLRGFAYESEYFIYDRSDALAFYYHHGID